MQRLFALCPLFWCAKRSRKVTPQTRCGKKASYVGHSALLQACCCPAVHLGPGDRRPSIWRDWQTHCVSGARDLSDAFKIANCQDF